MSKITKKQLHNGWHCHDTEIIKMKKELRELKQSVLRLEKLTDEKLLDEPQLKQLDQSIFDGLDEKWRWAAIDGERGIVTVFDLRPIPSSCNNYHTNTGEGNYKDLYELTGYDTSNWQNSLIERDTAKELAEVDLSSELTGSDLARAMLARGDKYVVCFMSYSNDATAEFHENARIVVAHDDKGFYVHDEYYQYAIPINNQGEPLTASEVGL